ncbi:MAG: BamA/TamA family outer membrane protein [Candidatus Eisenbacteria bacterium]|uniref:BamA/TamA family outer membrane protein n=1 Tax=Eiseniibacteriota bacterium TaxID=2212470 RepID=A0A849SJ78_UNCEI|nr:BamA/TamA family outer membrane protein [Candidatus Eisenbacteria bacterium]
MHARVALRSLVGAVVLVVVALQPPRPADAARVPVEVRGASIASRRIEALFERAPGATDSSTVVLGLARLVHELQESGWLDARARAVARDSASGSPSAAWRIEVAEGRRTRLARVTLETSSREDSIAFAAALDLVTGSWAAPGAIGAALDRALDRVVEQGFPYAELSITSFEWDSIGASLRLSAARGPAVTIERVRVDGLRATRPAFARRLVGALEGAPYRPSRARIGRDRLARSGLFRTVEWAGLEGRGDFTRADLVYKVEEPRYSAAEAALGIQGEGRLVGLADLKLDNLAGTGRALRLAWRSDGPGLQRFHARYAEPLLFGGPLALEGAVTHDLQDTLFTRTDAGLRLTFGLEARRRLELELQDQRVVSRLGAVRSVEAALTGFAIESDVRDDLVEPRRGIRGRIEGSQTFQRERLVDGTRRKTTLATARALLEWHRPLRPRSRAGLALELLGSGRFSARDQLELHDRFPLGGASSLRGFDEQQLRVDRYALSRLEWRLFGSRRGERIALFWDHAFTGTRLPLATGGTRVATRSFDGVGFGLRLPAAAGVVGLDFGLEPGRPLLEGRLHLQLTSLF